MHSSRTHTAGFGTAVFLLASAGIAQSAGLGSIGDPASPKFAAPVRLVSAGAPLGKKLLYPSPRLFDLDRDGQDELVIGDLWGAVRFAEKGEGDATWGPLEPFMSGKRALKFHNW